VATKNVPLTSQLNHSIRNSMISRSLSKFVHMINNTKLRWKDALHPRPAKATMLGNILLVDCVMNTRCL
jgi:hypothetical protein